MKRRRPSSPVAKAVARARLDKATTDIKIQLYLLQDGEPCAAKLVIVGRILRVVADAAALDRRYGPESPDVRKLRGAVSACDQMVESDAFQRLNLVSIDQALDAVLALNKRLDPDAVLALWAAQGWGG